MNYQQQLANSAAIRAEIQRFESVHPNIYSIYELLERVEEPVLQNQIREHVIAIEGEGQAARGFWKARGSGRPWRGGVCARLCACVCTHAAARRREHCGATCPARPASLPGKMDCQCSLDNGQWSLSCEKVARCRCVLGRSHVPSRLNRRLGAAAWDGATRSMTGYQAGPERLPWTLKMCFEKRCCWGCCSGQLIIQLLHGCLFFFPCSRILGRHLNLTHVGSQWDPGSIMALCC